MPNIFERAGLWFAAQVAGFISPERVEIMKKRREYYEGTQIKPLKTKPGQADDNLITNFVSLAVDRANAMLLGGGVKFTVPTGEESAEWQYLDAVWNANKKNILLNRWAQDGEIYGTSYIKIVPNGLDVDGVLYPRLQVLDPSLMEIVADPMDMEHVTQYIFEIKFLSGDMLREVTRRTNADEVIDLGDGVQAASGWVIERWESKGRSTQWQLIDSTPWAYDFPPIVHHQNMPSLHSVYGLPGISGGLGIQDKYNLIISNMIKIVRYHSHPKTWGRGLPANANLEKVSWGPDELVKIPSENGMLANLEMQSDLVSSRALAQDLRQSLFDLARVVDISSIADKAGQLTNFGLRVIYSDALAKNSVRRALYGDALMEINRRLLILANLNGANNVVWGSDLPSDEADDARMILADLAAGLVSKETASQQRGYTWVTKTDAVKGESDLIAEENAVSGGAQDTALARFFAGNNRNVNA